MTPLPTIFEIQRAVAATHRIRIARMREPCRGRQRNNNRRIARARQVAMCLAVRLSDHSLNRIGDFFGGRDHSTVIYACRVVEARARKDARLRARMRRLTLELVRR